MKFPVKQNVHILVVLMVALLVQPVGAMDHDASGLWSVAKSHPVLATTAAVAYAVTGAGLVYFGYEQWVARQNRINQERNNKLLFIVKYSQEKDEIRGALAQAQSLPYLGLENKLMERFRVAISNGNKAVATLCLESSTEPKNLVFGNYYGSWNISLALATDQKEIMELLSKYDVSGDTVVDAQPLLVTAAAKGAVKTVTWMLDSKADSNARSSFTGRTALHEAVICGKESLIPLLLAAGTDVNVEDINKKCALDCVSAFQAVDIMPILEREDLKFDAEKYARLLPIMASAGNLNVVQWLLKHGVDANAVHNGTTAMHCAAKAGNIELLKLLLDNNPHFAVVLDPAVPTPLMFAAGNGHMAVTDLLLQRAGSHPAIVDSSGKDAFSYAAENGHYFVARSLFEYQRHRYFTDKSAPKTSPVHVAINSEQYAIAIYVLDQGLPLSTKDHLGDTPLHCALRKPFNEGFMIYLLRRSTRTTLNMLNNAGETPLDIAYLHKNSKAIEMLSCAGAERAQELKKGGKDSAEDNEIDWFG